MTRKRFELEDQIRLWQSAATWHERNVVELERKYADALARNARDIEAEKAYRPELFKPLAEQLDSGFAMETPNGPVLNRDPGAEWRMFHPEASAILDRYDALEKALTESSREVEAQGREIERCKRGLANLYKDIQTLRDELDQSEAQERAKEAQEQAEYEAGKLGTLGKLLLRFGVS